MTKVKISRSGKILLPHKRARAGNLGLAEVPRKKFLKEKPLLTKSKKKKGLAYA